MTGDWFWSREGCVEGLQLTVLLRWSTHGCVHRECLLVLEARDIGVKLGEKICVLYWGRGQGGKGNLSRISAIELGMRLRGLDLEM